MNMIKILSSSEKNAILNKLKKQFGIEELKGIIVKRGKERLFLFQGEFDVKKIQQLERPINLERVGVYFAKDYEDGVRLSIEGVHLLKEQIKKNIFELNEEQKELWMSGSELNLKPGMKGYVVMKYENDFLGCGKASELKITNFIPKNRRLKVKN